MTSLFLGEPGPAPGGNILEGAIGEVLVFDRCLRDAEFAFVSAYVEGKWMGN